MSQADIPKTSNEAWPPLLWAAIGTAVSQSITHLVQQEFISTLIAALITAILVIVLTSRHKISNLVRKNPKLGYLVISLLLIAIVASPFIAERRWPFSKPVFTTELVPADAQTSHSNSNLEDAFKADRPPGTYRTPGAFNFTRGDGTPLSAELASFADPHNGALWLEAYIPSTPMTTQLIDKIIAEHQAILDKLAPRGALQMLAKGQHGQESTAAVRFTGKIIIYHEKALTDQNYDEVDAAAHLAGVNLLLRSPTYLAR